MQNRYEIFVDFDGTITTSDSLEFTLNKYVGPAWQSIEDLVTQKKITEKEALQKEFDLLHADLKDVLNDLKDVSIDPHFNEFVKMCKTYRIPLTVLSGGFDVFIRTIFELNGIDNLPFYSNSILVKDGQWQVVPSPTPRLRNNCNHCKSYWLKKAHLSGKTVVYIGDGNTDRCPAEHADIRFAKGALADFLERSGFTFYPFQNFSDIILVWEKSILSELNPNYSFTQRLKEHKDKKHNELNG